nr:hypothetical protein [Brevibacillus sp. WF146]
MALKTTGREGCDLNHRSNNTYNITIYLSAEEAWWVVLLAELLLRLLS